MYKEIKAIVMMYGVATATLRRDMSGGYYFKYIKSDFPPIQVSASLPVSYEEIHFNDLPAYFHNLLPEGWLLAEQRKTYKLDDSFQLLIELGVDLPGAVTVVLGNGEVDDEL